MQLLIVHDDAEIGEQLMSMLKDYTATSATWSKATRPRSAGHGSTPVADSCSRNWKGPRSVASRSVARSVKFFPGCKRYSSRRIPTRNNDSRSRKQKHFPNRSTASAYWKRPKPRRRQDQTHLIFFMSWMCSKWVA
jgi:hypothetical protein